MNDTGAKLAANAFQVGNVCQGGMNQCTGRMSGSRVHHHAGGFVNHQQVGIFKHHVQWDCFGLKCG